MSDHQRVVTPSVVAVMLVFVVGVPFLPLLISGHWGWWEAWVYALLGVLSFAVSRALAARRSPGILAERARFMRHDNAKSWDKLLAPLLGLGGALIPLVAGLDALLGWSAPFATSAKVVALALLVVGYVWSSYALIENSFFSGMVRLQTERGQQVISRGPYHWMRHPGYAGALLAYWATPILLNALWAYLPTICLTVVLVIRTSLEDQTLQRELEGYREYAQRVRYRLLPGVW